MAALPAQTVSLFTLGVGKAWTVRVSFTDAVQPEELVTVTVYAPAVETDILLVVAPVLQLYVPPPEADKVALLPEQTAWLFTVGLGADISLKFQAYSSPIVDGLDPTILIL